MQKKTIITGTGSYIPSEIVSNRDFTVHNFYAEDHKRIETAPQEVVDKFQQITGIAERRYAPSNLNSSDIATLAAQAAIEDSGIDPETLDQIIVAHNFGNVIKHTIQTDAVPSLASRVKHNLKIRNPYCVGYDVLFGCPGWVQGMIQADAFFKAGVAKKALVIGTETLSRVIDKYDRDSMIFSDGAGAVVLEYKESSGGILSSGALSHTTDEIGFLYMGESSNSCYKPGTKFMKMKGRKVYEYALK